MEKFKPTDMREQHTFVIDFLLSGKSPAALLAAKQKKQAKWVMDYIRAGPNPQMAMTDAVLFVKLRNAITELISAYLAITNPLVLTQAWARKNFDVDNDDVIDNDTASPCERDWTILDNVLYDAEKNGYDGVILVGVVDFVGVDYSGSLYSSGNGKRMEAPYNQYIVFDPGRVRITSSICLAESLGVDLVKSTNAVKASFYLECFKENIKDSNSLIDLNDQKQIDNAFMATLFLNDVAPNFKKQSLKN